MTPLQRATAAAIAELHSQAETSGCATEDDGRLVQVDGSFDVVPVVRAVIGAIREPSEAVLKAMRDTVPVDGHEWDYLDEEAAANWQVMIDAVLAEGE